MSFSCIFNKGHSVFTGKGNQYWFIIYKGSHWSVTTCGRSTRQVSFAASSIFGGSNCFCLCPACGSLDLEPFPCPSCPRMGLSGAHGSHPFPAAAWGPPSSIRPGCSPWGDSAAPCSSCNIQPHGCLKICAVTRGERGKREKKRLEP